MTKDKRTTKTKSKQNSLPQHLEHINIYAAGIDIGSTSHFVSVPKGCAETTVREFKTFTADLNELADWIIQCGVTTVAMESTGVYWIPVYEILEARGLEVKLVDARQVKNVSGRKTDVLDCQWIQQLHTYGLLNGAFRPTEDICALRSYVRQRGTLIEAASQQIQHMQKALMQMNLQLHHVIRDITGETGLRIIRAILSGERDPKKLASHRDRRCKNPLPVIEAALIGNYRTEHLFVLRQSLELYDIYREKIRDCDEAIEKKLVELRKEESLNDKLYPPVSHKKAGKNTPAFDLGTQLRLLTRVDLMEVPGLNSVSILQLIGEIGLDMTRWKSDKQFTSWLSLCPGNKVSGGKRLSGKSKPSANRAAAVLRLSASTLHRSPTALGAYLRRLKSRLGAPKAITATAHKMAKIIYNMLRYQVSYKESGQEYYEEKYRDRVIKNLKKQAERFGFNLVETAPMTA